MRRTTWSGLFLFGCEVEVGAGPGGSPSDESIDVLRSKYLDYCSSQLAELLLYLSPDDMYVLAQKAHAEQGGAGELTYGVMVRIATDWLAGKVSLPPFGVWLEDYRAHPDLYEEYFMGFWEEREESEA